MLEMTDRDQALAVSLHTAVVAFLKSANPAIEKKYAQDLRHVGKRNGIKNPQLSPNFIDSLGDFDVVMALRDAALITSENQLNIHRLRALLPTTVLNEYLKVPVPKKRYFVEKARAEAGMEPDEVRQQHTIEVHTQAPRNLYEAHQFLINYFGEDAKIILAKRYDVKEYMQDPGAAIAAIRRKVTPQHCPQYDIDTVELLHKRICNFVTRYNEKARRLKNRGEHLLEKPPGEDSEVYALVNEAGFRSFVREDGTPDEESARNRLMRSKGSLAARESYAHLVIDEILRLKKEMLAQLSPPREGVERNQIQ